MAGDDKKPAAKKKAAKTRRPGGGRKPKPNKQKELTGSKHFNPDAVDFEPLVTYVEPPDHITGLAREMWERACPDLCKQGVLALTDLHNLEVFCQSYKRWREAQDLVEKDGLVIEGAMGGPIKNPALTAAREASSQLDQFGSNLGLNPAARGRLIGSGPTKPTNPFDQF